ncbi:hypothetical protein LLG39_11630 [bacterium]|nr:hypothetical protein [bacterium]
MYADNYGGRYPCGQRNVPNGVSLHPEQCPNTVTWDVAIVGYTKNVNVFGCPSDGKARPKHRYLLRNITPHARSYAYNDVVLHDTWLNGRISKHPDTWSQGEIRYPLSKCVALTEYVGCEGVDPDTGSIRSNSYAYNDFGWPVCCCIGGVTEIPKEGIHQNSSVINYLFLDGHVKGLDPEIMRAQVKNHTYYYDYLRLNPGR